METTTKYPCDNHPEQLEWVICERQDKKMHLCYECYQELIKKELNERERQ